MACSARLKIVWFVLVRSMYVVCSLRILRRQASWKTSRRDCAPSVSSADSLPYSNFACSMAVVAWILNRVEQLLLRRNRCIFLRMPLASARLVESYVRVLICALRWLPRYFTVSLGGMGCLLANFSAERPCSRRASHLSKFRFIPALVLSFCIVAMNLLRALVSWDMQIVSSAKSTSSIRDWPIR